MSCLKSQPRLEISKESREGKVVPFPENMQYVIPKYHRGAVDNAGKMLVSPNEPLDSDEDDSVLAIINNWRASHSFPLNSFHVTLRARAQRVDPSALTAQRLKRLSSIEAKLNRFSNMQLSQMQDIGGCRAVVKNVLLVSDLADIYERSNAKNPKKRAQFLKVYDYIQNPKPDGYRSVHLIYKYRSASKRHAVYNNLRIEIQLRSQLQHAWATAVETVGTFIQQALKSSQGEKEWLRFFALMGTFIAMKERSPLVPGTPSDRKQLQEELQQYADQLNVVDHLELYASALDAPERVGAPKDAHYFLLELDPSLRRIRVTSYKADELSKASNDYLKVEKNMLSGSEWRDAVLVSVKSFSALKQAYPNYFMDTHRFIRAVREALSGRISRIRSNPQQGRLF